MAIIGPLPITLTNGTLADATQVMSDFNFIVSQVNANAAASGVNSDITQLTGLTIPLAISEGGTGTNSPSLIGGSNVTISGTWPNQTITVSGIGTGTVTSITAGTGLTGGTITSSGTIALSIPVAISSGGTGATSAAAALTNLGGVSLSVANTFTAAQIISLTTATTNLTLISTDAGAAEAPILALDRQSASPAAADILGGVSFLGRSSTGVSRTYGDVIETILDATNASEDANFKIRQMIAGSLTAILTIGPGVQIGAPTGGDKGAGTLNAATQIYVNNTAVSTLTGASQAQMEAASVNTVAVTPGVAQFHPGACKAWVLCNGSGTILASYNITSVTVNGTGDRTINISTNFSSANYAWVGMAVADSSSIPGIVTQSEATAPAAGALRVRICRQDNGTAFDGAFSVAMFGDQ